MYKLILLYIVNLYTMQKVKKRRRDPLARFKRTIICPIDGTRHIDKGIFAIKPHKKHLCVRKDRKTGKEIKHFFTVPHKSIGV